VFSRPDKKRPVLILTTDAVLGFLGEVPARVRKSIEKIEAPWRETNYQTKKHPAGRNLRSTNHLPTP